MLVAVTALVSVRRQGGAAYRRLAIAAFLFAVSDLLTSAAPDVTFGGSAFSAYAWSAHAAKFAAFLFLAAWFGSAARSSLRIRFVASFGALLVAVILALSTALTGVISNNVASGELDRVQSQVRNAAESFSANGDETTQLYVDVKSLAVNYPEVRNGFTESDPRALAAAIRDIEIGAEKHFVVVDTADDLPAIDGMGPYIEQRTGDAEQRALTKGDAVDIFGAPVVQEVQDGRTDFAASPTSVNGEVAIVSAARVYSTDTSERFVGVLVMGRFLDALTVEEISAAAGGKRQAPASLLNDRGKVIASDLRTSQEKDLTVPADEEAELNRTGATAAQQSLGNFIYYTGVRRHHRRQQSDGRPPRPVVQGDGCNGGDGRA